MVSPFFPPVDSLLAWLVAWASLVAQLVKNLPVVLETWVQSLGWEDPLEEGMGTHSSIVAWKTPWKKMAVRIINTIIYSTPIMIWVL